MEEFVKEVLNYLLANYALYMVVVMGATMGVIFGILSLLKKPIKALTAKIKNEKLRKLANKSIIALSFGLSALIWLVLTKISSHYFPYEATTVLITGALPVVMYALVDGVITKKTATQILDTVKDIAADGEVTKDEVKNLAESVDKKVEETSVEAAEKNLNNLLQ